MTAPRRMVIITDGYNDANTAKTAICLLRYRPEEVVAVLDRQSAGKTCQEVFGVGGPIPCVGTLAEAPEANTLCDRHCPAGRKDPAALAADHPGGHRAQNDHRLRAARVSARRSRVPPGRRRAWRATGRRPRQRRARRGQSPGHPRRLPAHPHHRQRLQLRQDGGQRRDRPRA